MNRWLPAALLLPAGVMIVVVLLLPVGRTMGLTVVDQSPWWSGYMATLSDPFTQGVLWRTLRIAALSTLIAAIIGFPTAYVIARSPPRRRSLFIILAVFPLLTNPVVRAFAWMVILGRNGFLNDTLVGIGLLDAPARMMFTEGAVVVGFVYLFSPLMILSLVGVLEGIDRDLLDAATSLGASQAAVFRQVVLPLAVPGLIVGSVLVFTGSFTAYTTPQLLGGDRNTVLATLLYQKAMVQFDWVAASTIAVVMVAMTVAVILVMNAVARRLNPTAG